jgi:hypothetical protein
MFHDICFITLTNDGYIDYTLNCYKSLEKCGAMVTLTSYVIGQEAFKRLNKEGYSCVLLENTEIDQNKLLLYRKEGWSNLMYHKINIVYKLLQKHDYVCITDGDIVFENPDFLNYCIDKIGKRDVLFQNNKMKDNQAVICGGFAVIKSNEKTKQMYDVRNIKPEDISIEQNFLKGQIKKLEINVGFLPLNLYPNGKYYYRHRNKEPHLIHFNWIETSKKQQRMEKLEKWYLHL